MMTTLDPNALPLRNIHLPDPVSWWPLALGWWIILLVLMFVMIAVIFLVKRNKEKRFSAITLAYQELERIQIEFSADNNKTRLIRELSELLRRVSISLFPRNTTASLTGETWLNVLDRYSNNNIFSNGLGRIFIEAPYQLAPDYDSEQLIQLVNVWLKSISKDNRSHSR